jgi:hypothetical protein
VEELAAIAQIGQKFAVAVDVAVQPAELADQRAGRIGVGGIEGFDRLIEQVVEV